MNPLEKLRQASKRAFLKVTSLLRNLPKIKFLRQQKAVERNLLKRMMGGQRPQLRNFLYFHKVLNPAEKKLFKFSFGCLALAVLIWAYGLFFAPGTLEAKFGGEYVEGIVGQLQYINPIFASSSDADMDLVRLVYNGLLRYDENYNLIPDLAESYTASEDNKVFTFKLKQGIKWHDGEDFGVDDVIFTMSAISNKEYRSPLMRQFSGITAEAVNDREVKFTLSESYTNFPRLMTVGIIPQHLWLEIPPGSAQLAKFNQKPIGTGPYKFDTLIKDKSGNIISYTVTANKNYHLQMPWIEKIIFKYFPDQITLIAALKNQQIDGLGALSPEYYNEVPKRNLNILEPNLAQFTGVFLNQSSNPILKEAKFRTALRQAVNKEQIQLNAFNNRGAVINSPILPNFPGYDQTLTDVYDASAALAVFKADGWETNQDGFLSKKDAILTLNISVGEKKELIKAAEQIKEQWESIGIKVEMKTYPLDQLVSQVIPSRQYDALITSGIIGYDGSLFPFFHSSQRTSSGLNLSGYVNRHADDLMEQLRVISGETERNEKFNELNKLIYSETPVIFLNQANYIYPTDKKIHNIQINKLHIPSDRFWNVNQWYIKTKKIF